MSFDSQLIASRHINDSLSPTRFFPPIVQFAAAIEFAPFGPGHKPNSENDLGFHLWIIFLLGLDWYQAFFHSFIRDEFLSSSSQPTRYRSFSTAPSLPFLYFRTTISWNGLLRSGYVPI